MLMSQKWFYAGVAALVMVLAIGCANGPLGPRVRTITVVGEGVLRVPPDRFVLDVGASSLDKDVDKAWAEVAGAGRRIVEAARAFPIDEQRTYTTALEVYERYEKDQFQGYNVHQDLRISLIDLSKRDELTLAVFRAGADRLSVDFTTEENRKELFERARLAAVQDARQKAERMAAALGDRVGPALQVGNPGADREYGGQQLFQSNQGSARNEDVTDSQAVDLVAPTEVEVKVAIPVRFALLEPGPR
jgi:uncharacterized protein YggE